MRPISDKFYEVDEIHYTTVDYVSMEIRVFVPGAERSQTFALREDARLMDFGPMRRPIDERDIFAMARYEEARRLRYERIKAMATKLAHAIYAAFDNKEFR